MKYINETRPAFDNTSKAKCILKLMNMSKNMNECITRLHFSICFQQFCFFFIQFGWALSFNCHIFYVGFVFFIYFLILIIMELFRIIPALLMVTHIHTQQNVSLYPSVHLTQLEPWHWNYSHWHVCCICVYLHNMNDIFFQNFLRIFFHAIFFFTFLFNV